MRHHSIFALIAIAICFTVWTVFFQPTHPINAENLHDTVSKASSSHWPTDLGLTVESNTSQSDAIDDYVANDFKKVQPPEEHARDELPIKVKLLGTDPSKPLALLENKGIAQQYELNERVFNTDVVLSTINDDSVELLFLGRRFVIELFEANVLATKDNQLDVLSMDATEIGNRPKVLEHILQLTPTPFIADGMLVDVGVSKKLFEQAGFETDDVLKTVNGLSVTIEDEKLEIQRQMRTADTLVFVVERRGRLIKLFLDIPEEALTLTR